jgi:predicted transcriptional regulator
MRRPAPSRDIPPPLELECLKALWVLGHGRVRDVREALAEADRPLAYTTVMTLLARLEKRGGVTRHKQGRAFVYEPKVSRQALRQCAVRELIDGYFDGSEEALIEYLVDVGMDMDATPLEPGREPSKAEAPTGGS